MKCIENSLIQQYIDKEICSSERKIIESHISGCAKCAKKIKEHQEFTANIKKQLDSSNTGEIVIPEFDSSKIILRKKPLKFRKMYFYAASIAAFLILAILFFFPLRQQKEKETVYYFYNNESEYDANRTISKQDFEMQMIDQNGNVSIVNF